MSRPRIVILGGGFGGLYAARALRRAEADVTVVDRRNFHLFQPLLYQVATAALNPSDIAAPIRSILRRQKNVSVMLGEAASVDTAARIVKLADGADVAYDYLVVATGATHSYFAHPEWERDAPGLKTIEDALEIRRRVLLAFEEAERETDPEAQRAWLTFVVVGAGATGAELAGALSEIARQTMVRDFRRINPSSARVVLVEGKERVLPTYPPDLSAKAEAQLKRLRVEVLTNAIVTSLNDREVCLTGVIPSRNDGEGSPTGRAIDVQRQGIPRSARDDTARTIATRTVLWAAGVQASPLAQSLGVPLDRAGRVLVQPDLTIPGHPEVFVIGDLAATRKDDGSPVPGVAPAAIQQGGHVARNLDRAMEGQPLRAFHYNDKGSLATIGRAAAVAEVGKIHISGFLAWLAWLFIHILYLIGFRNRLLVLLQWAWAYLTFQRGARLITRPSR